MRTLEAFAILAAVTFGGLSPARADVLPFRLQGMFIYTQSGPSPVPSPFSATLLIDTTAGKVVDFQSSSFNNPMFATQGPVPDSYTYIWSAYFDYVPDIVRLVFETTSLIGYNGGPLVDLNHPDPQGNYTEISQVHVPRQDLVSGSVTPLAVPVPEPSSFAVLAAAAVGLASRRPRRRRQ